MKHFSFALGLAIVLLSSCQNSDSKPGESQAAATAPAQKEAPKYDFAVLEQTAAAAKATAKSLDDMLEQLDKLPAKVKKQHAAEVEALKNDLTGVSGKQRDMMIQFDRIVQAQQPDKTKKVVETTDNEIPGNMSVADYMTQFDQYAKLVEEYKARIEKLK